MKPITFHAEAEIELAVAADYYERQRDGLGRDFCDEFEAALKRVRENPLAYAAEDDWGVRLCPVHRFLMLLFTSNWKKRFGW